ncbi:MAG: prepilin peptidase [bacterium]|jgi:leader peptidase (prepilin peptidase)/N-methyltransferase|nr:prepilin peptidase [bacterium]
MDGLLYTYVTLIGLAIGSFANVLIYRLPREKNVVLSRSACPNCGTMLRWYHNIPLISYLVLRGKCGFCKKPISSRYPLVEAVNALMYLYFLWRFGMSLEFLVFCYLGTVLLVVFFIDLDFQIIPDLLTYSGMVLGLLVALFPGGISILNSAIGLLVGGGSLYLIAMLGDALFKKESMGGGDIKLAAMLGAFLGWQKVLLIFLSSAVIGLVISLAIMAFSAKLRQERVIPFGPFIALAAVVTILYGDQIIAYYLHNILGLN